jgi:hypothetical protein
LPAGASSAVGRVLNQVSALVYSQTFASSANRTGLHPARGPSCQDPSIADYAECYRYYLASPG